MFFADFHIQEFEDEPAYLINPEEARKCPAATADDDGLDDVLPE